MAARIAAGLLAGVLCLVLLGAATPTDWVSGLMERVRSAEPDAARLQADEARRLLISGLCEIAADPSMLKNRPRSVEVAMGMLGDMRAVEGAQVLVDNIAYPAVVRSNIEVGPGGLLPPSPRSGNPFEWLAAPAALISIGEPCMPMVLKRIGLTDHVLEHEALLGVLIALEGEPRAAALLREAAAQEHDEQAQRRLKTSQELLPWAARYVKEWRASQKT